MPAPAICGIAGPAVSGGGRTLRRSSPQVAAARPRSMIARPEQGEAEGAHVDDPGEARVVDDRQVPEVAVRHDSGCLTEAGSGPDDNRLRGHHFGDPDLIDVLAVGYGVCDVGVGDDSYRPVGIGV